ncbi:MAG: 2Fe-2S iron-sulfur cluster-binding protein [Smithella sp.]
MVNITIDGKSVQAREGSNVLQEIRNLRIDMPTLCYHEELVPFGACRLCTVEVKANGKWKLAASCDIPVDKGLEIRTASEKAIQARKLSAKLLYYRYPTTAAVRDIAEKLGVALEPAATEGHDCVLCGLCVRTCRDIVGAGALSFQDCGLGRDVEATMIEFRADKCIGCGSCAFVCPTSFVKLEDDEDKRVIWNKVFKMAVCDVCGRYFAPEDQLKHISKKTGCSLKELAICTNCR